MFDQSLRNVWTVFQREHQCSLDRMLCNPVLRNRLIEAAHVIMPVADEEQILWSLVSLRKKKTLPRTQR